jgi:hypothetical protein
MFQNVFDFRRAPHRLSDPGIVIFAEFSYDYVQLGRTRGQYGA